VPRDDEISFHRLLCTCHPLSVTVQVLGCQDTITMVLALSPSYEEDNKQANQFKDYCSSTSFIMLLSLTPHARTPPFHEITNSSTRWVSSLVLSASQPVMGSVCIKLRLQRCHVEHTSQVCQLLLSVQSLVTIREDHSLETSTETAQRNTNQKVQLNSDRQDCQSLTGNKRETTRALEPGGPRNKVEWEWARRRALDR
jgi:hypothetical protein